MSDPSLQPESQPYPQPPPRAGTPPRCPTRMIWLLVLLVLLLSSRYLAEQIEYGRMLGRERAKADAAKELLAELPEGEGVWPWVAKAIAPSVVGIETDRTAASSGPPDEWAHLFGAPGRSLLVQGEGSGVVVDGKGYVITNYHVIQGAEKVRVRLAGGRTTDRVEVVGVDPPSDVALLKVDVGSLPAATWGDSDQLEVGDPVLAVGNPFGLERSVTSGIISAKGRQDIVPRLDYQDFLQTDAAVNPGNSGGPLVNARGEVVGINTAIHGEAYQGVSFAIPSNMVRHIFEQLKDQGQVARGWLGVAIAPVTPPMAEKLKLAEARGAFVSGVLPGSPAAKAGIRPGDVILRWNDTPVNSPGDLSRAAAATEIGAEATLRLIRDGQEQEVRVTVSGRPEGLR